MNLKSWSRLIVAAVLAYMPYTTASAQSFNLGGQTCTQNYSLYDYSSNGVYNFSSWEPDGVSCFDNGGGSDNYSGPGNIGGGGTGQVVGVPVSEGTWVNKITKTVTTNQINCTAEFGSPEYFASLYWLGDPQASVGTEITLNGAGGASWKFRLSSKQYNPKVVPVSGGTCP